MKKNTWKTVLTVVVLLALAAALVVAAVECANGASLANTAWSLLPPVIAIILALITKEAYSALFIGVLVGGLFTCGFAPVATLDTIVNDGLIAAISGNAGIFLFLVLGVLLYIYIGRTGLAMPVKGDQVFSLVAVEGGLPVFVGILFVIGLISSTYSAAGSALTALTTSFTVDILQGTRRYGDERLTRIRKGVHVGMAVGMALVILGFEYLADFQSQIGGRRRKEDGHGDTPGYRPYVYFRIILSGTHQWIVHFARLQFPERVFGQAGEFVFFLFHTLHIKF